MKKLRSFLAFLIILSFVSCASAPQAVSGALPDGVYQGSGRDQSPLAAMNKAKLNAVDQYLHDLLGDRYDFYKDSLKTVIFSTDNPNQFVKAEDMVTIAKGLDSASGSWFYSIQIPVQRSVVKQVLQANNIVWPGASGTPTANAMGALPPDSASASAPTTAALAATSADFGGSATPQEQRFIRQYIDTLTYMVYWNENSAATKSVEQAGATQANRWLTSNGYDAVDLAQVEKNKAEDMKVYQEETGGTGSYIQYVAQKLNAGVYIELSVNATGGKSGGLWVGQVNLLIKCFDPSTGELLGSTPFNSPQTVSPSGTIDAETRAIEASVWQAMPVAVAQVKAQLAKTLVRGLKYDLVLQNTSDPRLMSEFRRKLSERVKLLTLVSASSRESRYQVFYLGTAADLSDLIYQVSGNIPGLEGMNQVMLRGRALTFTTGLK